MEKPRIKAHFNNRARLKGSHQSSAINELDASGRLNKCRLADFDNRQYAGLKRWSG